VVRFSAGIAEREAVEVSLEEVIAGEDTTEGVIVGEEGETVGEGTAERVSLRSVSAIEGTSKGVVVEVVVVVVVVGESSSSEDPEAE
jgi:hypothetical protein